jgi:hypothetical protein
MPGVVFEPAIPLSEQFKFPNVLHRATTGLVFFYFEKLKEIR